MYSEEGTNRSVGVDVDLVSLVNEHVDETRLAVMQMPNNRNVSHHLGVRRQSEHEPASEGSASYPPFLYRREARNSLIIPPLLRPITRSSPELANLDRLNDRLRERLRILLLDHRLDSWAVQRRRRGVIRLVVVENHRIRRWKICADEREA